MQICTLRSMWVWLPVVFMLEWRLKAKRSRDATCENGFQVCSSGELEQNARVAT
jgi:hypothetical protein